MAAKRGFLPSLFLLLFLCFLRAGGKVLLFHLQRRKLALFFRRLGQQAELPLAQFLSSAVLAPLLVLLLGLLSQSLGQSRIHAPHLL